MPVGRLDGRPIEPVRSRHTQSEFQTGLHSRPERVDVRFRCGQATPDDRSRRRRRRPTTTAAVVAAAASQQRRDRVSPSSTSAAVVARAAAAAHCGVSTAVVVVVVFVDGRVADSATADSASPGASTAATRAVVRRRSLAGGHRPADRTKIQFVHLVEETPVPSSHAASFAESAKSVTADFAAAAGAAAAAAAAATIAAAADAATGPRAGGQARVGDTQAQHRGAGPEQSAADRGSAVHAGHGVLDAHPEGAVDHATEEDRLLHGRAHGRHAVPQENRLLHGPGVLQRAPHPDQSREETGNVASLSLSHYT